MTKTIVSPVHIEWTPGRVRAIDIATGESAEAEGFGDLKKMLNGHRSVIVGVGRSAVFLKTLRLPKASVEDLRKLLGVQLPQLFPLPADELAFDFVSTSDFTPEGWLNVVAAMRSSDLRQLKQELRESGLTATRILPLALSAPSVVSSAGLAKGLLVERGSGGLGLDVVEGGVLRFSRTAGDNSNLEVEVQRTLAAARVDQLSVVAASDIGLPEALPAFGTSLSLLHQAPPFDFELAEERDKISRKKAAERQRVALLMLVAAILLPTGVWAKHQDANARLDKGKAAWERLMKKDTDALGLAIAQADNVAAVESIVDSGFKPAQPLSDTVAVVSDSLPPKAWLNGITLERGKAIDIRGTAESTGDIATLVNGLGESPRFRDVRIVFANASTIGKTPVVKFDVSATCVGNLPMPAAVKTSGVAGQPVTASAPAGGQ